MFRDETRKLHRNRWIVPLAFLALLGHSDAAGAAAMPPSWMPMTMLVVSYDTSLQRLDVQDQAAPVTLAVNTNGMGMPDASATTFADFDPAEPWSVLQNSAFSRRLGWWAGTGSASIALEGSIEDAFGPDASIWIESISISPGLESYLAIGAYGVNANNTMVVDPNANGYTGIFGTAGSSTRWQWDYQMDHNAYAVPVAHLLPNQSYSAMYRVYIGDAAGDEIAAAIGASTIETWTWVAPASIPVPEPATAGLALAGLGALLAFGRRRA
ncbi:MAG: PEP-CTERM sorting domain-containing protein [Deltaproteobacteria bacterium]|nr:PEP-CTERM sorting domain-containing protein [Deltaproteobacteria bacterium]